MKLDGGPGLDDTVNKQDAGWTAPADSRQGMGARVVEVSTSGTAQLETCAKAPLARDSHRQPAPRSQSRK